MTDTTLRVDPGHRSRTHARPATDRRRQPRSGTRRTFEDQPLGREPSSRRVGAPELTFATFNMHRGLDMRGQHFDEVQACAELDADVIALQEAPNAPTIGRALGYDVAFSRCGDTDVALLTRVPMSRVEDLALPSGCCGPRLVVRAYVPHADGHLRVACTHLCHKPHGSVRQLLALRRWLDDPSPVDVFAGDLNMWFAVVSRVLPAMRPVVHRASWPSHRPHSQIDHVLVGPAIVSGEGATVRVGASDHLAIRTTLRT